MNRPKPSGSALLYVKNELKALRGLRSLNYIAAALHFSTAFLMYAVGIRTQIPITTFNTSLEGDATIVRVEQLFVVDVFAVVAAYLCIAALFHLLSATLLRTKYTEYLKQHRNPLRWIEYSFSCSLMLVALCAATGITQLNLLIAIFFASATMNLSGLVFENVNRKTQSLTWSPYVLGCILGLLPWILMFGALVGFSDGMASEIRNTAITYSIVLALFALFPLNMFLTARRVGRWKSYVTAEVGYIALSYVAKSSLALMLYFNLVSIT